MNGVAWLDNTAAGVTRKFYNRLRRGDDLLLQIGTEVSYCPRGDRVENAFLIKMRLMAALETDDEVRIHDFCRSPTAYRAGADIDHHGEPPTHMRLVLSGLLCRYKLLRDGTRQIVGFLIPGDICDMHLFMLDRLDHSVGVIEDATVVSLDRADVSAIALDIPRLNTAMERSNMIDLSVAREWLVNNGRREALGRVAHLLWELYTRYAAVDRVIDHTFRLYLTQKDIADATSLSHVHVSRTLTQLRVMNVLALQGKLVQFLDAKALSTIADFRPDYLHGLGPPDDWRAPRLMAD